MTTTPKSMQIDLTYNTLVMESPDVQEQLSHMPPETAEAYLQEVLVPMSTGEIPGKEVDTINGKHLFYTSLTTGEMVFYELTPPKYGSTPPTSLEFLTHYSIHFVVPKHEVDSWERKTFLNSLARNAEAFTKPVRKFLMGHQLTFFVGGILAAIFKFFFF